MADDIAALIDHLGLEQPDVVGYSLGWRCRVLHGGRSTRTRSAAGHGLGAHPADAIPPEMLAQQGQVSAAAAEFMKDTPMYELYQRVAPRPEDFGRLLDKMGESMAKDFDFSEEVRGLRVPTLIVAADADMAPPSHYVEVFELLDGGQRDGGWMGEGRPKGGHALAILPGLTHYNLGVRRCSPRSRSTSSTLRSSNRQRIGIRDGSTNYSARIASLGHESTDASRLPRAHDRDGGGLFGRPRRQSRASCRRQDLRLDRHRGRGPRPRVTDPVTFNAEGVNAHGGCNSISGPYTINGDRFKVTRMASTAMGCEAPLLQQDEWLVDCSETRGSHWPPTCSRSTTGRSASRCWIATSASRTSRSSGRIGCSTRSLTATRVSSVPAG